MKKKFLTFGSPAHMRFAHFAGEAGAGGGAKKKKTGESDDDDSDASDELKAINLISKQVKAFNDLLGDKADAEKITELENTITELKEGIETLTSKEVFTLIEKINTQNESLHKQIIELQEKSAEELEAGKEKPTPGARKNLVTREAVVKFIEGIFGKADANGKAAGEKNKSAEGRIEIKAAETFGYPQFFQGGEGTDITAFTGRYIDPTLYMRKRKRNLILDNFDIQTINVPTLVYLVKVEEGDQNPTAGDPGAADWVLSGQSKPQRSFRVTTGTVDAKKVAIYGNVEDKLLRDVASLENWIREDFMLEMNEKINDGLLNNNPDVNPNAPLGLKTNAIQFTPTPAFTQTLSNVTYIDALIAIFALFIQNHEEAAMAFVSSDVYFRILSLKDTQARYLNNPLIFTNALGELYIAGVKVMWADEEDIPSTSVLVIGVDLGFKIKAYNNMVFEKGLNGNDFREDKTSYRGYQEFLTYIPENRENSVLYDTWTNVEAAITTP